MSDPRIVSLPGWLDDRDDEHPEAEECRALSPDERGARLVAACEMAMEILRNRPDADVALAYRAPLPGSSIELLQSLHDRYHRR